jgi:hypothetical protein
MTEPDLNQITNLTTAQKANSQGLLNKQGGESADYLKRYTDFLGSQEGASAMSSRIGEELGIPSLQKNATMLRNTLTNLPGTYSKAMTGYDVNQNQLSRVIGQKSSELSPIVETTERALAGAQNTLGQRMGFEQADQQKALLPYQTEKELLSDRQARETTLYSQDNQNELNGLITKINAGITLSEGEKNRAAQLAASEKQYELEKEKMNQTETQIIEVGGRKKLINSRTGQVIQDLGSSSSGSTASATKYLPTNYASTPSTPAQPAQSSSGFFNQQPAGWVDPLEKLRLTNQIQTSGGFNGLNLK